MISKEDVFKYLSEGLLSEDPFKKWFNFKEDDADTSSTNIDNNANADTNKSDDKQSDLDKKGLSLNWNFIAKFVVLYEGPVKNPNRKYEPFANVIRYYEFDTEEEMSRKEKEAEKQKDLLDKQASLKKQADDIDQKIKDNRQKHTSLHKDMLKMAGAAAFGLVGADIGDKYSKWNKEKNDINKEADDLAKQKEEIAKKYAKVTKDLKDKNGRSDSNEAKAIAEFHSMAGFKEHAINYNRIPEKLVNEFIITYQEQQELAKNGLETDLAGKNVRAKI